ncbi:MAG TPA: cell shape determination protein CcmA [Acidobacteria bacterium]|nr:cell shape determination protein CcmA [Acidobacteriota bacterium]MEE2964898.1 polymer-forming cytoskeletal protein [Acidobacteriota bacterium]HCE03182.1 cell shape determination protein CcmA [Acidobacteriota bacterium]
MWKREEAVKPVAPSPMTNVQGPGAGAARAPGRTADRDVYIGKSVVIKGEVNGSEDLTIEGQVEGKIELRRHVLTIGPHGRIRAEVLAKTVVVLGEVVGNIKATDKVAIQDKGAVEGDITAPKVAIAEGSRFRGSVDMSAASQPESKPTGAGKGAPDEKSQARPEASASKAAAPVKGGAPQKVPSAS